MVRAFLILPLEIDREYRRYSPFGAEMSVERPR